MPTVTLTISDAGNRQSLVVVNGSGFFGSANKVFGVRIMGEDEWFDDSLFGIDVGFIHRVDHEGNFIVSTTVPNSKLNEDWGRDEVYASVKVDGAGTFKSNVVKRYF